MQGISRYLHTSKFSQTIIFSKRNHRTHKSHTPIRKPCHLIFFRYITYPNKITLSSYLPKIYHTSQYQNPIILFSSDISHFPLSKLSLFFFRYITHPNKKTLPPYFPQIYHISHYQNPITLFSLRFARPFVLPILSLLKDKPRHQLRISA